ncbi:MAG: prepilin peptidase [Candidatus Micrarchaeia archaeon]
MELELLRVAIAVLGTAAAAAFDVFNNRNVPNWLTYAFVGLGLAINLVFEPALLASALLPSAIIFLFGWLLWQDGQIGGADVLILAGLALLLPQAPTLFLEKPTLPSGMPFVVSIFVLSGIVFLVAFTLRSIPAVVRAVGRGEAKVSHAGLAYALALLLLVWFFVMAGFGLTQHYIVFLIVVMACAAFVLAFKETITDSLIERVPLSSIEEEDILAIDRMDPDIVRRWRLRRLLTREELAKLKKTRLKEFPVLKRLPTFLPWVLIALLISLRYGDFLSLLTALALGQ